MLFQKKKYLLVIVFILVLVVLILSIRILQYKLNETERVSVEFSNSLFQYPIPPKTDVIDKKQFNGKNWIDGGGSGGYWEVVAFMKMSSRLSEDEILKYYKDTLFPYPKSNVIGVELEIYFEDDLKEKQYSNGFYYRSKGGQIRYISSYFNDSNDLKTSFISKKNNRTNFIIQIHSGFSYFLQID